MEEKPVKCYQCGCDMSIRPTPDGDVARVALTLRDGTVVRREMDIAGLPQWHCAICGLTVTDESHYVDWSFRFGTVFKDLIPLAMHPHNFAQS
jgi:hypothetical protein